ncbi:FAD-dependent oxidoreductase [Ktedonosporobacter rubrisoli]|uniref:FAD-dependent oxidoreductase n=1 Tax=Ktedonosporobacter rubrisoli TaxID=2509675 RepID=A0A4P6JMT4_KTERU|nr:FAD-dependent monooxygenase [Ktedonosporobacter rubrisoli]QBD76579.1 FAD-dependent oxidoreductase [Ktedonosporobacter rubrisoli]
MTQEHVPVLIVGGGIVGLSASLFLSEHGIRSLLVERHRGTSIHPRARGVNARTMELYRELGIAEAVRAAGAELAPSMGIFKGRALFEVIEPRRRKEGKRKLPAAGLFQKLGPVAGARGTQDKIEPVLLQAAREHGGDLRFYTELIEFAQDETGVTATIRERESGTLSTIRADYLLAADGASSPTRQMLGVSTSGRGVLGHLLNILFQADLHELVRGREFSLCQIERPEVRGLFTSINNSDLWVFHLSYDPNLGEQAADFPAERCKELLHIALGLPDIEIEIKSILPWQSAVRVADGFQHGRVFLAGDAAHQMPPWGGQGANTGVADAHNLAWKLAAVLKGKAGPELLSTYDSERRPVGRLAAEESGAAADEHGLISMKKSLTHIIGMVRRMPRLLGYGYEYTSQAIISAGSPAQGIVRQLLSGTLGLDGRPGTRAPHIWVQYQGQRISTLDLFGKNFVLLTGSAGADWLQAAVAVREHLDVELDAYRIGPSGELLADQKQWPARAGISEYGALLIRPDGFVAWRSREQPGNPQAALEQVLKQVLFR